MNGVGLDYADQRYFASLSGRFLSSDPYEASGGASEPGSWNRYPYVGGDPVNFSDRTGLARCPVGSTTCIDVVDRMILVGGLSGGEKEGPSLMWDYSLGGNGLLGGYGETEQGGPTGVGTGSTFAATNTAAWNVVKKIRAGFDPAKNEDCLKGLSNIKVGGKSVFTAENVERLTRTSSAAGGVFFMDGTQSTMNVSFRPPGSSRVLNMPASQAFASDATVTAIRSGDAILLRPGIEESGYFSGTILHELLHLMGADDIALRTGLFEAGWQVAGPDRNGVYARGGPTADLSKALNERCF